MALKSFNSPLSKFSKHRSLLMHYGLAYGRFEPDMLAFSGCYFGGGEKERQELGTIRKRWKSLHVRLYHHLVIGFSHESVFSL